MVYRVSCVYPLMSGRKPARHQAVTLIMKVFLPLLLLKNIEKAQIIVECLNAADTGEVIAINKILRWTHF